MHGGVRRSPRGPFLRPKRLPRFRDPAHADLWTRGFDDEIHQPVRFLILSVLHRCRPAGMRFASLRDTLRLTDGNLSHHLDRLERLEYVVRLPDADGRVRFTSLRLTTAGREAYARHAAVLRDLMEGRVERGG